MSTNKLSHLLESSGLDWSSVRITLDQFSTLTHTLPLLPNDFLGFASADIKSGGIRGNVNAISNAKRAIDCQVEYIVGSLGYRPNELRAQLGKGLVSQIEKWSSANSLPFVFRFLESIGMFTPAIVDRVRILRHDVEHRFHKPTKKRASEAWEIATLFVRATESITVNFYESFGFGSGRATDHGHDLLAKEFYCRMACGDPKPHAEVLFWARPRVLGSKAPSTVVLPEHESYYWLVRMAIALSRDIDVQPIIRGLIAASKAKIPPKSIRVIGFE